MLSGTEVLHVYSTGLNGSLPRDLQSAAILHLRGAYGPSMSQMYADQGSKPASEADLPRAPLRSRAKYLEFCQCLLDEDGQRCWREMLVNLDVSNSDAWVRFAAKYATLPPLPAHLALPASVWSIVSSMTLPATPLPWHDHSGSPRVLSTLPGLASLPDLPV